MIGSIDTGTLASGTGKVKFTKASWKGKIPPTRLGVMSLLESSNPVLADGRLEPALRGAQPARAQATVGGVVNKTCLCLAVAVVFGAIGNSVARTNPGVLGIVNIVSFVVSMGVAFAMYGRPAWASVLAPVYAAVQGFFLGAVALVLDAMLARNGIKLAGGVALQAFLLTSGVSIACMVLYRSGAVRITERGAFVLWCAVHAIAIAYLATFVLGLFGIQVPFLSLPTQAGASNAAYLGLAINGVILIVAALTLVADIQQVDMAVRSGAPASAEWYLAYGLLVSLVWIYMESLKIVYRLALIFGGGKRD